MRLRFVGSDSPSGSCPTIYETDRNTYVIQGRVVTDPEALEDLRHVLPGETFVEIPPAVGVLAQPVQQGSRGGHPVPAA
jgi:hypothetical protein